MKFKSTIKSTKKEAPGFAELTDDALNNVIGGAMIINHNMAAINTLTQQVKNNSSLSQSMTELSTGTKTNPAADAPSGFQNS